MTKDLMRLPRVSSDIDAEQLFIRVWRQIEELETPKDFSRELDVLVNGALPPSPPTKTIPCLPAAAAEPRTPRKVARLRQALSHISADCDYGLYRDIVWGVLSTGWPDAEEIARQWCMSAPSRFEERSFNSVVASFNPALAVRPRLGTVFFHAKQGGWSG